MSRKFRADQFAHFRLDGAVRDRDRAQVRLGFDRERAAEVLERETPGNIGQFLCQGYFADQAGSAGFGAMSVCHG